MSLNIMKPSFTSEDYRIMIKNILYIRRLESNNDFLLNRIETMENENRYLHKKIKDINMEQMNFCLAEDKLTNIRKILEGGYRVVEIEQPTGPIIRQICELVPLEREIEEPSFREYKLFPEPIHDEQLYPLDNEESFYY